MIKSMNYTGTPLAEGQADTFWVIVAILSQWMLAEDSKTTYNSTEEVALSQPLSYFSPKYRLLAVTENPHAPAGQELTVLERLDRRP